MSRPAAPLSAAADPERDQRLANQIRARLRENPLVDETRVDIQVFNAEVTLSGVADNRFIKQRAEELTSEVQGVTKILNEIGVQPHTGEPGPVLTTQEPGPNKTRSTQRQ